MMDGSVRIAGQTIRYLGIIVVTIVAATSAAQADTNPVLDDRFTFYLGGFFPDVDSSVTLHSDFIPGPGDRIDFEDEFSLEDSKNVLWGGMKWQISRRNQLQIEYLQLNRDASAGAVTRDFVFGDSIVQVGAEVDTEFDLGIGRVTYGYSFINDDNKKAVLLAGLHWADVEVAVGFRGAVIDAETGLPIAVGETKVEDEDIAIPLPHLGGQFSYAFSSKWLMRAQLIGFKLEVGDWDGTLIDAGLDLAFMPWRHFGIGVGYRYFDVDIEGDGSSLDGEFEFEYKGPTLFAVYSF